jgi:hypothetical protein
MHSTPRRADFCLMVSSAGQGGIGTDGVPEKRPPGLALTLSSLADSFFHVNFIFADAVFFASSFWINLIFNSMFIFFLRFVFRC